MTAPHNAAHDASTAGPFTEAEVHEFQVSDIHAARVVVLLMTGIFTVGLLLYSAVALVV